MKEMTTLSQELLKVLDYEPQTKDELKDKLHISEREVRRCIKELRDAGYAIASSSRCKGYWLASKTEKEYLIREYLSRIAAEQRTVEALRKGPDLGQMEVEV